MLEKEASICLSYIELSLLLSEAISVTNELALTRSSNISSPPCLSSTCSFVPFRRERGGTQETTDVSEVSQAKQPPACTANLSVSRLLC